MSEVGIIGQMYEDRRTKKRGKVVQRDEKFKTLLMESPDGKSFNISYGGFKSNWRIVDEPEETLEEVPIPENVEPVIEVPKAEKRKYKERDVSEGLEKATLRLLDYAKDFNDNRVVAKVTPEKRRIALKVSSRRMFVISYNVRSEDFQVCVNESFFLKIKDRPYVRKEKYNESWASLKYSFLIEYDKLEEFLVDAKDYTIEYMCSKVDEEV